MVGKYNTDGVDVPILPRLVEAYFSESSRAGHSPYLKSSLGPTPPSLHLKSTHKQLTSNSLPYKPLLLNHLQRISNNYPP